MRDPHVEALFYKITSHEGISYDNPNSLSFSNLLGDFELSTDGVLTIRPMEHFPSETIARNAFDPFLRSWEIEDDLTTNIGSTRFNFDHSEIVDRNPPQPGENVSILVSGVSAICGSGALSISPHVTRKKYPDPPYDFEATNSVSLAYRRWIRFKEGKEPLQAMAYFVLTVLEDEANGRKNAALMFKISLSILNKIGELTSEKGDDYSARKAKAIQENLTPNEKQWLEKATRMIIYQIGKHASAKPYNQLTMSDLPQL